MDVHEEVAYLFWGLLTTVRQLLHWIKAHPYEAFVVETGMLLLMLGATWGVMHRRHQVRTKDEDHDERL